VKTFLKRLEAKSLKRAKVNLLLNILEGLKSKIGAKETQFNARIRQDTKKDRIINTNLITNRDPEATIT
jgi:hypothetical protein